MHSFLPGAILRPGAFRDIEDILFFLAGQSQQRAERFSKQFTRTVENLVSMPRMGAPREVKDAALPSLRMLPVQNFAQYLIWYQPFATNDGIEIVRVLHHSRDYLAHLADESTSADA